MKANVTALLVALAVACTLHIVNAQTNVNLNIQLYAGLSVMGQVGRVYQVQYATEVSETNTWYALQHFELKWNPHESVDTTCPATEKRFYRAVEVEVPTNVVPVANMVFIPGLRSELKVKRAESGQPWRGWRGTNHRSRGCGAERAGV